MKEKILIVEDEFVEANHVQQILEHAGYRVAGIARSVNIALKMLEEEKPDLVLVDIFLKGSLTGIHLGTMLKEKGVAFVYLSANSNRDTLEMVKPTEPYGFLVKPFREKDLLIMVEIANYLQDQQSKLRRKGPEGPEKTKVLQGNTLHGIIGESASLQAVLHDLRIVAPTDISVLILGETGTGKEMVAETIHSLSPRKDGSLIKVNCAAMPATLIESILFGHEAGAFTGATQRRRGKFEQAHGGTIFLDEIGEIGIDMQVKLLRVLQEKEIELLGGEDVIKVNCRIITATNRDLSADVAAGRFRMDLYYRLNVFPLLLPPLRERQEDIPALTRHFVERYCKKLGKPVPRLSAELIADFQRYHWPGNIRELEHAIERMVLLTQDGTIHHIPLTGDLTGREKKPTSQALPMEELEKKHIIEVLQQCKGKIAGAGGAAEILKMNASTLHSRIRKLGIKKQKTIH